MHTLLKDAQGRSQVFAQFGAIPLGEIETWMSSASLILPPDLVEFWSLTGGGDLFDDSATIHRPTQTPASDGCFLDGDDVDSLMQFCIERGMPKSYLAFASGIDLSVVRLTDQKFVTLDDAFEEIAVYSTFDEWYLATLRADFGDHYGLPPEDGE